MHFSFGMLGQLLHSTALTNRKRQTFARLRPQRGTFVSLSDTPGQKSITPFCPETSSSRSSTLPQAACALLASVGGQPGLVSLLSD